MKKALYEINSLKFDEGMKTFKRVCNRYGIKENEYNFFNSGDDIQVTITKNGREYLIYVRKDGIIKLKSRALAFNKKGKIKPIEKKTNFRNWKNVIDSIYKRHSGKYSGWSNKPIKKKRTIFDDIADESYKEKYRMKLN